MFGNAQPWRKKMRSLLQRVKRGTPVSKEDLEALLYEADLSPVWVESLLKVSTRAGALDQEELTEALINEVVRILEPIQVPMADLPSPAAILLLGVNGAGKTTMSAKLGKYFKSQGRDVVFAAADTFRAGAIDQLKVWADRIGADLIAQKPGADPAAVVFDAWQNAVKKNAVLIADTAGRLHTKKPLVEELEKIVRILGKDGLGAPHACYLVLDGTTGQNALAQSREFVKAAPLTGLIITKLDGTARGGAALSAALELSLPIRYLGVGEQESDIVVFDSKSFAEELFRGE